MKNEVGVITHVITREELEDRVRSSKKCIGRPVREIGLSHFVRTALTDIFIDGSAAPDASVIRVKHVEGQATPVPVESLRTIIYREAKKMGINICTIFADGGVMVWEYTDNGLLPRGRRKKHQVYQTVTPTT